MLVEVKKESIRLNKRKSHVPNESEVTLKQRQERAVVVKWSVVNVLAIYSDNPSSNHAAEVYSFFILLTA